jgi:hypothetical protein
MQFMGILDAATQNGSDRFIYPESRMEIHHPCGVYDPIILNKYQRHSASTSSCSLWPGMGDIDRGKVMLEAST